MVQLENASDRVHEKPNIKGDRANILLLILLYMLQGVVAGFSQAYPIIFQNRKVSYADQAAFSITGYPFAFKLLWAPIVDCMYSKKLGRRKTWLIPTQYLIGFLLLFVSMNLDDWLGSEDGTRRPKVRLLAIVCFVATLCNATQDIALDGWSLTMLQRRNVGYAAACSNIGSTIGQFLAYVVFIVLDSKDFCNMFRSVPQEHGFVSLTNFVLFWSIVMLMSTTIIFGYKKDNSLEVTEDDNGECRLALKESYKCLWQILQIRPMIALCLMLLTCRIGFGPLNGVAPLKMIDAGVSRENFVLLTIPALPSQMILSVVFSRFLTGPGAINSFIKLYILKLVAGVLLASILFFSTYVKGANMMLPSWYYWMLLAAFNIRNVIKFLMWTALGAFFSHVSDPRYGGIYFAIYGTMVNLGANLPVTLSLWCVNLLTFGTCVEDRMVKNCFTKLDGFYVETVLFTIIGALWLFWGKNQVRKLERLEASAWMIQRQK